MNYQDLQTAVQQGFNRRDVTTTQIQGFITTAIQRTQRLLGTRVPANEQTLLYTVPSDGTFIGYLAIPGDYLKFVSMTVDGGNSLDRRSLSEVQRWATYVASGQSPTALVGVPKMFARDGAQFLIGPQPQMGSVVKLVYNADFSGLVNPTDYNWLTTIASDILIDGAVSQACKTYTDPRRDTFESSFTASIVDLINQAADDELTNAQVNPASQLTDGSSSYVDEW